MFISAYLAPGAFVVVVVVDTRYRYVFYRAFDKKRYTPPTP